MVQLRQCILNSDLVQSQICSWRAKNVTGQKIKFSTMDFTEEIPNQKLFFA